MNATRLAIPDVMLFEPRAFADARGEFFESFNRRAFEAATGLAPDFVQDNQSRSRHGVVRGLHYQLHPFAQGKLVRVVQGAVFDVAVDLRRDSPTFGRWVGEELTAANRRQLWVPPGFAHGFQALAEDTVFLYKTSDFYDPASERAVLWNDPAIGIAWPLPAAAIVNAKDAAAPLLGAAALFD
jgi:dTDP-4-dehydrorhamnose 3,5-epimerase